MMDDVNTARNTRRRRGWTRRILWAALAGALLLLLIDFFFGMAIFGTYTPRWFSRMSGVDAYLRFEVRSVQLAVRDECILDRDEDGKGEFGTLADLLPVAKRIGATDLVNTLDEFRPEFNEARLYTSYLLKVFIPQDPNIGELTWCAVAWPARYKRDARFALVYWVSPDFPAGRTARAEDKRYSGWGKGPHLEDVFSAEPFKSDLDGGIWGIGF